MAPELWESVGDEAILTALDAMAPIVALQGIPRAHWRIFHEPNVGPIVG
ncbi:MAG TPA: hypothetical protein VM734_24030 [Kofleriaceae bacterium]|jgi:hypothetical protein|nr:hypothetical protein [Kofleriaceae bacterium]